MSSSPRSSSISPYDAEYAQWASQQGVLNSPLVHHNTTSNDEQRNLLRVLRKRRKALACCVVAAVCCATLLTLLFQSTSWKYSMIINYTPTSNGGSGNDSPTANTLPSFFKAPKIEETMRSEFPDYDFGDKFEEGIEIKVDYGTQAVQIELAGADASRAEAFRAWAAQLFQMKTWSNPQHLVEDWHRRFQSADQQLAEAKQESEHVLNRLKTVFADSVAEHLRATIRNRLVDQRAALAEWNDKLEADRTKLAEFNKKYRLQDIEAETSLLLTVVAQWETRLEDAKLAKSSSDKIKEAIQEQKEKQDSTGKSSPTDTAANQLITPQRQIEREQRLRDVEQLRSQVKQAKKQFEYDTKLHEKQFISDAVFAQKQLALESLEDQLASAERIWQLQLQVEETNVVLPAGVTSESVHMVGYIEKKLAAKRDELARLQSLREQAEHLKDQVTTATGASKMILDRVIELERLEKSNLENDFQEIQPATFDKQSAKSTGKKWFVVSFILCCLLFGAPVVARDLLPQRKKGAEAQAEQLGIPVLVRDVVLEERKSTAVVAAGDSDERSRLLALRIQQSLPRTDQGAVVLFSGLEQAADVPLLTKLASCWARRGERVLLLDSGDDETVQAGLTKLLAAEQVTIEHQKTEAITHNTNSAKSHKNNSVKSHHTNGLAVAKSKNGLPRIVATGLTEFLQDDSVECTNLIQKTEIPNVDCIMAGDLPMPVEGLATHRMTELLRAMRDQYSLIVLMGPSTSRPVDLELLAARADAIVFSTDGSREASPRSHAVVKNLIELNAPVLGVIS